MKFSLMGILLCSALCMIRSANAQEINATVTLTNTLSGNNYDPRVFKTLEASIANFINNRKWTDDEFEANERIACTFFFNIVESPEQNVFVGQLTIQSSRPVHNTSYLTPVFRHIDQEVVFKYVENDPIEFSENIFTNNLSSLLAFYVNIILGYDYDSFSPLGGTKYFEKCENIANNVPFNFAVGSQSVQGWKQTDGRGVGAQKNRFWLSNNLVNPKFEKIRRANYLYHMKSMDILSVNPEEAKKNAIEVLNTIMEASQSTQLYISTIFVSAKGDEIINMFATGTTEQKKQVLEPLVKLDATNADKFRRALK
jgi:hypothetical protein